MELGKPQHQVVESYGSYQRRKDFEWRQKVAMMGVGCFVFAFILFRVTIVGSLMLIVTGIWCFSFYPPFWNFFRKVFQKIKS